MTVLQRLLRLLEKTDPPVHAGRRTARLALLLLALAVIAALGTASWIRLTGPRIELPAAADPRPAYVNRIRAKIQKATQTEWSRLSRQHKPGMLRMRIEVGAEGQLLSATIMESSGIPALDDLALRIVRESAPFEPFPAAARKDTKTMEITSGFDFQ